MPEDRKIKYLVLVIVSIFLLAGCTVTHPVYLSERPGLPYQLNMEKFNNKMNRIHFTIVLKDGRKFSAHNVLLGPDSTFFTDSDNSSRVSILTNDIRSLQDKNHALGGLQGIFLGTLGGVFIPGGIASLDRKNDEITVGVWVICGGMVGGACGLFYGLIYGYTDVYELRER